MRAGSLKNIPIWRGAVNTPDREEIPKTAGNWYENVDFFPSAWYIDKPNLNNVHHCFDSAVAQWQSMRLLTAGL